MRRFVHRPIHATALALSLAFAAPLAAVLPAGPAFARPAPDSFADLAAKLLPAVVNVASSTTVTARNGGPGPDFPMFPPGSPFEQFFKDFLNRNHPGGQGGPGGHPDQPTPDRRMQSLGSGFIVDPSGIVVTNNHVIDGADEITVTLQDNTSLKAKVLGRDETGDIALLQVKPDKPLPAVPFGDSDAERERTVLLAEARATADRLRGEGEAGAIAIYAKAFSQDPWFFGIYRTLQGYRDAFATGAARLVITPDNAYLRYLQAPPTPPSP